jgi:hypothetical protein
MLFSVARTSPVTDVSNPVSNSGSTMHVLLLRPS